MRHWQIHYLQHFIARLTAPRRVIGKPTIPAYYHPAHRPPVCHSQANIIAKITICSAAYGMLFLGLSLVCQPFPQEPLSHPLGDCSLGMPPFVTTIRVLQLVHCN